MPSFSDLQASGYEFQLDSYFWAPFISIRQNSDAQTPDTEPTYAIASTPFDSPPPYTRTPQVTFSDIFSYEEYHPDSLYSPPELAENNGYSHSFEGQTHNSRLFASRPPIELYYDELGSERLGAAQAEAEAEAEITRGKREEEEESEDFDYGPLMIDYLSFENAWAVFNEENHCPTETAVNIYQLCLDAARMNNSYKKHRLLEFGIVLGDGGRYSPSYGVENILRNDRTVYCSGRPGAINILLRYHDPFEDPTRASRTCVISHVVIKSPRHGYTGPCKEGMVFISHEPISVESTHRFDHFTKKDYDDYIRIKGRDRLEDTDPVGWFSGSNANQAMVPVGNRSGKYALIKLLRAEIDQHNIDLQYVGMIGYCGSCSFSSARFR
ncbi:hypothetical protein BDF14DRAFT_1883548 [Spinellus fusiger]|nr:hypothetical protein BDF14DRAFT_1883548 [Spinellus fusiger]